ncbi:hypothetical protein BAZSYMA_ACONTIG22223_3 [Bathymodiolus azoricus thioautotrophic gill symbiont]|uniref:Uncharacterized protein n=1 Tax=Bathymodiolus azoricus thioautotrophic gill symbiont TaxID=235205 RepID=A0A1H6LE24_9GAMM|nr:hypothetical protein BAZSYMA_ACONTIG22223_3 [Bathymodiolus azoricus thioautotrophic gill symbiont]
MCDKSLSGKALDSRLYGTTKEIVFTAETLAVSPSPMFLMLIH